MSNQHFDNIGVHDNARVHVGNSYDYSTHTHHGDQKKLSLREALEFRRMDHRYATIATAFPKTSEWLFETQQYARWHDPTLRSEIGGCLWIKGKPGAGKSTVMKALLKHTIDTQPDCKIVSFFFNARGERLEQSVEGMYRALLCRIADSVPQLQGKISYGALEEYAKTGWPLELLKDLCREAILHVARCSHLFCFIDALDEGDIEDDVRDMIDHFAELADSAAFERAEFSMCFVSRHYPRISIKLCEELVLEVNKGHQESIASYVTTKLRLGSFALERELGTAIQHKSAGVFLWVVLVIGTLNKEADRGNQYRLRETLQAIPLRIKDLIREIVLKDHDERFLPAVQWLLFSCSSLTPEALFSAIMVSIGRTECDSLNWHHGVDFMPEEAAAARTFVLSSTKGLAEITGSRSDTSVQFIHETVREYFLESGMQELDSALIGRKHVVATCHARLARWCHEYYQLACPHLTTDQLDPTASSHLYWTASLGLWHNAVKAWPLLKESLDGMLQHAESAAEGGINCESIETTIISTTWSRLKASIEGLQERPGIYKHLSRIRPTMLHILVYENYVRLVNAQLREYQAHAKETQQSLINAQVGRLGSALHIAAAQGHREIAQILLNNGADVNSRAVNLETPLFIAVDECQDDIVDVLLRHGADVCATSDDNDSPFSIAIRQRRERIVNQLLYHGKGQDAGLDDGGLALSLAVEIGKPGTVEALLCHVSNINASPGNNGCVALHAASEESSKRNIIPARKGEKMLRLLLSRGADVNAQCSYHGTALHIILQMGYASILRLLLDYGADVNLFCGWHGTALNVAIMEPNPLLGNRLELLNALLTHGKDLLDPIGEYGNAIETAGEMSDYEDMRALMIHGVDVQAEDFSETGPYKSPEFARAKFEWWREHLLPEHTCSQCEFKVEYPVQYWF